MTLVTQTPFPSLIDSVDQLKASSGSGGCCPTDLDAIECRLKERAAQVEQTRADLGLEADPHVLAGDALPVPATLTH